MSQGILGVSCACIEGKDAETCVEYIRSRHAAALPRAPSGGLVLIQRNDFKMQNDGQWLEWLWGVGLASVLGVG